MTVVLLQERHYIKLALRDDAVANVHRNLYPYELRLAIASICGQTCIASRMGSALWHQW